MAKTAAAGSSARWVSRLGAPVEQVQFAGVKFGGALVFAHGFQRIAQLLFDIGEAVMKLGIGGVADHGVAQRLLSGGRWWLWRGFCVLAQGDGCLG